MKKLLLGLFMLTFAFTFVACNEITTGDSVALNSDSQVFTLEALSGISLLDNSSIETLGFGPAIVTTESAVTEVEDQIDNIDHYIELMETYLGNDNGLAIQELVSDREAWDNLVSFTSVDVLGNEVVYYLYYNETVINDDADQTVTTTESATTEATTTEAATTETPETTTAPLAVGDTHNFNFSDDDDSSVQYALTGVIVKGDLEYSIEGKRIVKEDGTDIFRMRSFIDKDNFVRVDFQTDPEDGHKKFFYEVKEDGVIVSKSKVQIVEKDGATMVRLNFEDSTQKSTYQFNIIEEDGIKMINIRYNIQPTDEKAEKGNIHIQITIDPNTGEEIYTYKILGSNNKDNNKRIEKKHNPWNKEHKPNNNGNL